MCGIVGYCGHQDAATVVLAGLRRLEARGYDSAGIATVAEGTLHIRKAVGRLDALAEAADSVSLPGILGIGHTRWATHGRPSVANAHPQIDRSGRIALVHNGVIENHAAIREFLQRQGVTFRSETDTESLTQLIGFFYEQTGDLLASVRGALREVRGTLGIAVVSADAPETLIAARRGSPLMVGSGPEGMILASDAAVLAGRATQVTHLEDNEIVCLGLAGLTAATMDAVPVQKQTLPVSSALAEGQLDGFAHHMLKEIFEQPEALQNTLRGRLQAGSDRVTLGGLKGLERQLPHVRRAILFGCGTSWHAALVGEYLFEDLAGIPTEVEYGSELRYRNPLIREGTVAIAISQSGETADSVAALREVRERGATTLGVVNSVGSTIARECDAGVYLHAGPEIGIASTKGFTAQVLVLALLALDLGRRRQLSPDRVNSLIAELLTVPDLISRTLDMTANTVKRLAERLASRNNWLFLGRGINFPVALEGALKAKEVSRLHAEGLPAAEIKHGPLAMIEPSMPVIVIVPQGRTRSAVLSNMAEVRARGGNVIAITSDSDTDLGGNADETFTVPHTSPLISPLVNVIPLQLLAYHAAIVRGIDVDKPREAITGAAG